MSTQDLFLKHIQILRCGGKMIAQKIIFLQKLHAWFYS